LGTNIWVMSKNRLISPLNIRLPSKAFFQASRKTFSKIIQFFFWICFVEIEVIWYRSWIFENIASYYPGRWKFISEYIFALINLTFVETDLV
jgi:hypothetical protein